MRLEVDVGNTSIKWRLLNRDASLKERGMFNSSIECVALFTELSFYNQVSELLISCVAGKEIERAIASVFMQRKLPLLVFIAKSEKTMCGVEFAYTDVERLGVDRCLAMVAAYNHYKSGVLVIDCGSAMTADLILDNGEHKGGYILPGFGLLERSLLKGTSEVLIQMSVMKQTGLGLSTEECVENGRNLMMVSTLNSIIEVAKSYGVSNVLLTGGDGLKAKSLLEKSVDYDEDLIFKGLSLISSCSQK